MPRPPAASAVTNHIMGFARKALYACAIVVLTACGGPAEEPSGVADAATAPEAEQDARTVKKSAFGVYVGYSTPQFEEWTRTSQYVAMRDGVRLAVDVVRPAVNGAPVEGPTPAVFTMQRYGRAYLSPDGKSVVTPVESTSFIQELVRHGYAYVTVGIRGTGASFGNFPGVQSANEARDAHDVTAWIVSQEWSNGAVGMMGNSYRANAAMMATSDPHPALKAIFPSMMDFDAYETSRPGGILLTGALSSWTMITAILDGRMQAPPGTPLPAVAPVDGDKDRSLFDAARAEHVNNVNVAEQSKARKFRDDVVYAQEAREDENMLAALLPAINRGGVAIYLWSGWNDIWPKQPFLWMANLKGSKKLAIGPWSHDPEEKDPATGERLPGEAARVRLQGIEMLRWFDYWLKGVDNGVMDEPAYAYAVMKSPDEWEWRFTNDWPLKAARSGATLFLDGGPGGDGDPREGILSETEPEAETAADAFAIDFTATTTPNSRWMDATSFNPLRFPDMSANAGKGLSYVLPPASAPYEIIGHPVVTLYMTSTAPDADVFVYLDKIDADGRSVYLTEGQLRASRRTLGAPPYENFGLPWPTHARADAQSVAPLSGNIAELTFDLLPLARRVEKGDRLRLIITGADADNFELYMQDESPTLSVMRSAAHPSRIVLPITEGNL